MPTFEFLHAADLHLDSPLRGLEDGAPAGRIRGATREALVKLVELALERRVAFLLLAGDLYDGDWKDWRTGHFLVEELARLTRANIPVIAISGNHDADQVLTRNLSFPGTMLSSKRPETFRLPGLETAIHGQSFATRAVSENLARHYPEPIPGWFNIGLLHTACGSTEHDNYAPCTEAQLAAHGYDYWALGHVHTRHVATHARCRIVFPGNIQGRHIREEGAKGATLVRVESGEIVDLEHHALDVMRWKHVPIDASGAQDIEAILDRARLLLDAELMQAEDRLLAVRVTLSGSCPAHAALVRDTDGTREKIRGLALEIADRDALWIEDVRVRTMQTEDHAALASQPGAAGALISALDELPPIDTPLRDFVGLFTKYADLLEPGHAARAIEAGELPTELVERARALLLAELVRG